LFGRRRLLALGLILFAVASLACGLAQWPIMLIASRIVQGSAGALVSPAALSLLTTANPEGAARNRALAIWQAVTAGGATTGIVAGGLLTQYLGWRAVFLVNPPLIAIMLALIPRLPGGQPAGAAGGSPAGRHIDGRGATLITMSIAALIYGLSSGQQHGFGTAPVVITLVAAVVLMVAFVYTERHVVAPMLPLSIFADPARRAAVAAMLMMGAILAGYVYFISLYLQKVQGYSPVETGLALLPSTLTVVLTSTFVTRRLLARFELKWVLLAGLAGMAGGQLWLGQISAGDSYPAGVLPGLLLTALGIGLGLPTASVAITAGVRGRDQGLAVLATAAAARTAHTGSLVAGYRLSFLIGAGIAVLAAAVVAAQLRTRRSGPQPAAK
jgi:Major Facilitator Superfamily